MYVDALTLVSQAQVFAAAGVSTNSIDLGNPVPKRELAAGEPVAFGIAVISGATAATTKIEVIMATDGALTAGIITLIERTYALADLPTGMVTTLPLPQPPIGPAGWPRYLGLRVTPASGTVTLSAWLAPSSMISVNPKAYAKGYTITG